MIRPKAEVDAALPSPVVGFAELESPFVEALRPEVELLAARLLNAVTGLVVVVVLDVVKDVLAGVLDVEVEVPEVELTPDAVVPGTVEAVEVPAVEVVAVVDLPLVPDVGDAEDVVVVALEDVAGPEVVVETGLVVD